MAELGAQGVAADPQQFGRAHLVAASGIEAGLHHNRGHPLQ